MILETGDFLWVLLWTLDLHSNRTNLKPILHRDILSFFIVSQKLFHISGQNLILNTFGIFSFCNVKFVIIDLNKSVVNMKKFRNSFFFPLFLGFIFDR
jgi:hypothetical protein